MGNRSIVEQSQYASELQHPQRCAGEPGDGQAVTQCFCGSVTDEQGLHAGGPEEADRTHIDTDGGRARPVDLREEKLGESLASAEI